MKKLTASACTELKRLAELDGKPAVLMVEVEPEDILGCDRL